MSTNKYIPHIAIHPGFFLKGELESRGISNKEFAHDIGMPKTMLSEIINEKRSVTADIALLFEKALDIAAKFWLDYQSQYDIDKARIREKNTIKTKQIETWKLIKQFVPVSFFAKRKILTDSLSQNILKIWEIFDVDSIDELVENYSIHKNLAFYKKSERLCNDQKNIFAWSKLAQWQIKSETVGQFSPDSSDEIIGELKELFLRNINVIEQTKFILNKYGIKFLIIEKFNQSPIDGYSFWSLNNPAVVLTLRKKNLDNFAFAVLHELGHVFLHLLPNHTEDFLEVDCLKNERIQKEREADSFANNNLIDEDTWQNFLRENRHFEYKGKTTERKLNELSSKLHLHPSIVWGRYRYDTKQYNIRGKIDTAIN